MESRAYRCSAAPRWVAVVLAACSHPVAPRAFDRDLDPDERDLRVPSLQTLPPSVAAQERWFDVDLDEQVLVAYEGTAAGVRHARVDGSLRPPHAAGAVAGRAQAPHDDDGQLERRLRIFGGRRPVDDVLR